MTTPEHDYWSYQIRQIMPKVSNRNLDALRKLVNEALDCELSSVEVVGARVGVETVDVYGLTIQLDANANAVTIESPYGFIDASM